MKEVLILLALLLPQIRGDIYNLTSSRLENLATQCKKLSNFFSDVIGDGSGVRDGIVNVAIADYSNELDVNSMIKNGLMDVSEKVVIFGVTKWKFEFAGIEPDYFVYVQDYSRNNNLSSIGSKYYKSMKASTKSIIITNFNSQDDYDSPQIMLHQVNSFYKSINYANPTLLNIFGTSHSIHKYTKTLDYYNYKKIDAVTTDDDFRPYIENLKIAYQEVLPYSYLDDYGRIVGVDGNLINEFCKHTGLDYKILNERAGQLLEVPSSLKIDIELDRRSSTDNLKTHDIAQLYETSPEQCFLAPRNIPVYRAFSNPFDTFVTYFLVSTIILIAVLWKFMKWLQDEELSLADLIISILKVFIGLAIDEDRWRYWSMKERCLLMPFLFMSIILIALYQSFLISTLIVEHPMKSVRSMEQLNKSETQIYEYSGGIHNFRDGKVVNAVPVNGSKHAVLMLHENYDKDLAYAVKCRFAEDFVRSKRNMQEKRILFDVLYDPQYPKAYSTYVIAEDFPYKEKFKFTVIALEESGVTNFWTKRLIRDRFPKHPKKEDVGYNFLGIMIFPFILIGGGIGISFGSFLMEGIHSRYYEWAIEWMIRYKIFEKILVGEMRKKRIIKVEPMDGKLWGNKMRTMSI